jgi:hypothetical protein
MGIEREAVRPGHFKINGEKRLLKVLFEFPRLLAPPHLNKKTLRP